MLVRTTFLMSGLVVLLFLLSSAALGFEARCIKTQPVKGEDCNHLVVHFDFAGCGLGAPPSQNVRSQCVNQKAVAFVRTKDTAYIATYGAPLDAGGSWVFLSVRSQERAHKIAVSPPEAPQTSDAEQAPVLKEGGGGGAAAVVVPEVKGEAMPSPNTAMQVEVKKAPSPPAPVADEPLPQDEAHGPAEKVLKSEPAEKVADAAQPGESSKGEVAATQKQEKQEKTETKAEAKSEEKSEAPIKWPNGLKLSGIFDFYYLYNTNVPNPVSGIPSSTSTTVNNPPVGNNPGRLFDNYHDTFTMNLAEVTLVKEMENGAAQVDLGFGNQASVSSPNDIATQNILRAFITWNLSEDWKLRAGKLFSHLGVEEPYATENINYSRSYLFTSAVPLWNTGLAFDWTILPKSWTANFYIYNNNGNSAYENNAAKSVGFRLEWKDANTRVRYNAQAGSSNLALDQLRQYHELNLKWQARPHWFVVADGMMGYQPRGVSYPNQTSNVPSDAYWSAEWIGIEWTHNKWAVAPRFEYYSDPQGYTINGAYGANTTSSSWLSQNLTSFTTTVSYRIAEEAKVIFEYRADSSDQSAFYNYSGTAPVNSTTPNATSQTTLTAAFLYEF